MELYDISPPISDRLAVWPGDSPSSREVLMDMARGDNLTLSTHRATVHLGAHADAPSHYVARGESIEQADLSLYVGPCRVVEARVGRGQRVASIAAGDSPPRLLIKTGTFPDPEHFNEDFAGLEPDLIDQLAGSGVRLIGIDTPSVDTFDSKELPAHQSCHRNDLRILEGLMLAEVPVGDYELIALPLKLRGFDASPVRAVLRTSS